MKGDFFDFSEQNGDFQVKKALFSILEGILIFVETQQEHTISEQCQTNLFPLKIATHACWSFGGNHKKKLKKFVQKSSSPFSMQSWLAEIREYASPNVVVALVGNKADLAAKRMLPYLIT